MTREKQCCMYQAWESSADSLWSKFYKLHSKRIQNPAVVVFPYRQVFSLFYAITFSCLEYSTLLRRGFQTVLSIMPSHSPVWSMLLGVFRLFCAIAFSCLEWNKLCYRWVFSIRVFRLMLMLSVFICWCWPLSYSTILLSWADSLLLFGLCSNGE